MDFYIGLDWGCTEHLVCVLDARGELVEEWTVQDRRAALADLVARIRRYQERGKLGVCLELKRGRLVDLLEGAGIPVYPVQPNALASARYRYATSGSKSDRQDAYGLADLLRLDERRLRRQLRDSEATEVVRALKSERDALVSLRQQVRNSLEALLRRVFPGFLGLFAKIESPTALGFLTDFPSWKSVEKLTELKLQRWLKDRRYSGRRPALGLLQHLREASQGLAGGQLLVLEQQVRRHVQRLELLASQIKEVGETLAEALDVHPDAEIFRSFPMVADVLVAGLISAFGDRRERYPESDALAAVAGIAPVTIASGKSRRVVFRIACNRASRNTLVAFANLSRRKSEWAASFYKRRREQGDRHPEACRALARAWLRILDACWKSGTCYDPARHQQRLQARAQAAADREAA